MAHFNTYLTLGLLLLTTNHGLNAAYQMEHLGRGLVVVRTDTDTVYLSWRFLGTEPDNTSFNIYRSTEGSVAEKLNDTPITDSTNYVDTDANTEGAYSYSVRATTNGNSQPVSQTYQLPAGTPARQYFDLPLNRPQPTETDLLGNYSYSPNDCSVADLDGDGDYEIIVKWDPSNSHDNSQNNYSGRAYLDAYEFDGTQLWRIDLGINIRSGAHYTQFMVYDFDGDGKAELACKTADGSTSGTGEVIGNANADYRNSGGWILDGPEFLTLFDGETGAILSTVNYVPLRGNVSDWGDDYGNRVDRFLAGVAYLDGERPSLIMCRGYYTRIAIAAWDWRDGQLTQRWVFDTTHSTSGPLAGYRGQGAHSLTVGDVDGDGRDEIVYGSCTIDDDGTGLYTTELGHGDAQHLSDMDPTRPGLEYWMVHETPSAYGDHGSVTHDAATGEILFSENGSNSDIGRGVAADIDPRYVGFEVWSSRCSLHSIDGTQITTARPASMNFLCYWDGDLLREILDHTYISKWNWNTETQDTLLVGDSVNSNNTTKATPNLSADLFGDWREEVIWRHSSNEKLRIYTTTIPTAYRIRTLMHDRQYRLAIAWQNVGYNQPPHPSFYIGPDMAPPLPPEMYTVSASSIPTAGEVRFPDWLEAKGLPRDSDPALDHDQNGTTLYQEYAFESEQPNVPSLEPDSETEALLLNFSAPRTEIDYILEASTDLIAWDPQSTYSATAAPLSFLIQPEIGKKFFRLSAASPLTLNTPPVVQVTSPSANAAILSGTDTALSADASDSDGAVQRVEFILDGLSLGEDWDRPFSLNWTATGQGLHQLRMIATDNMGAVGYSPVVDFSIHLPVPTIYQAEDGTYGPHEWAFESSNSGYEGTGYINSDSNGSFIELSNIDGGSGGAAILGFRYALGASSTRNGRLIINGIEQSISFDTSNNWTTWITLEIPTILLAGETNVIRLETTGEDLANIDSLSVSLAH